MARSQAHLTLPLGIRSQRIGTRATRTHGALAVSRTCTHPCALSARQSARAPACPSSDLGRADDKTWSAFGLAPPPGIANETPRLINWRSVHCESPPTATLRLPRPGLCANTLSTESLRLLAPLILGCLDRRLSIPSDHLSPQNVPSSRPCSRVALVDWRCAPLPCQSLEQHRSDCPTPGTMTLKGAYSRHWHTHQDPEGGGPTRMS